MECKNCGTVNTPDARFCSRCGADLSLQYNNTQQGYNNPYTQQQNYNPYGQPQPPYPPQVMYIPQPVQVPAKGLAIASLVCGIVTLALFCVWYVSVITGILSIIFGAVAKSKGNRSSMPTAGIVCGSIGIGLMIIFVIIAVIAFGELWSSSMSGFDSYYYY